MPRSIFLSYVYEDKRYGDDIKRWCDAGLLGRQYVTITEGQDLRQLGDTVIQNHLRERIRGSAVVLTLVGDDTHDREWVRKELAMATSLGKVVLLMGIPGTRGAAPEGFRHHAELPFDPSSLRAALAAHW
jgi:hypothetical protein